MYNVLLKSAVFQYEPWNWMSICGPAIGYTMCCKASNWDGNTVKEENIIVFKNAFLEKLYDGTSILHTVIVPISLKNIHCGVVIAKNTHRQGKENVLKIWLCSRLEL